MCAWQVSEQFLSTCSEAVPWSPTEPWTWWTNLKKARLFSAWTFTKKQSSTSSFRTDNFQAQLDNMGYINQKVNERTRSLRFEYQRFSRPPPAQREHATCSDCLVTEKTTGKLFAEYTFSYVNMPQNNANKDTFPPQAMCIK